MKRAVVQLSGGMDSSAALLMALEKYDEVFAVFFDYGQPYLEQELRAVSYMHHLVTDNPKYQGVRRISTGMSLQGTGNVKDYYVPLRNMVFAALSANYATAMDCDWVVVGSKESDVFKDCRREFFNKIEAVTHHAAEDGAPRIKFNMILHHGYGGSPWTRAELISYLLTQDVNIHELWSCYNGRSNYRCGECLHCIQITEACKEVGVVAPKTVGEVADAHV